MTLTDSWGENATLTDGTRVRLRYLRPEDAEQLREGFARLSERSRYLRFHGARRGLTPAEVAFLCSPDGHDHVAVGALGQVNGEWVPAGVARYIRTEPGATSAEAAITVVDAFQRKGLGKLLLKRLLDAARSRDVNEFEFVVMPSNEGMLKVLDELGATVRSRSSVEHRMALKVDQTDERTKAAFDALRLAAQRLLEWVPPRVPGGK